MADRWAIPVRKVADLIPSSPRPLVPEPEEMAAVRTVAAIFWREHRPPALLESAHLETIRSALEKCRDDLAHLEFGEDCAEVLELLGGEVR
jgi:hypothetical protein